MKKSFASRLISMVLVLMMVFCTALSASAAPVNPEDEVMPMYNGVIEGANSDYISGGYGELRVHLGRNITDGAIKASVSPTSSSGTISVSVKTPSGTIVSLGAMACSGGSTLLKTMYYLPSGYYTFYFYASSLDTFYVQGYIYS